MKPGSKILIAVLDWGLGHATRCIPVIECLKHDYEILIAGTGASLHLLKNHFPGNRFFELPAYRPRYGSGSMVMNMARQLPHFVQTIHREHRRLQQIVKAESVSLIISDNRYGCHSSLVPSVFITHQLHIQMPDGWKWMQPVVNHFNHRHIRKFTECWVPDTENENPLAGRLSQRTDTLPDVHYIGPLSRFQKLAVDKRYEIVAVVSGPEPARTTFETLLRTQLKATGKKCLLVRGLPDDLPQRTTEGVYEEVSHLTATELNEVLCAATYVVARSGYSTIMDLAAIGAKALLVPTPGQTEQEHLADQLQKRNTAAVMQQSDFDLAIGLKQATQTFGFVGQKTNLHTVLNRVKSL